MINPLAFSNSIFFFFFFRSLLFCLLFINDLLAGINYHYCNHVIRHSPKQQEPKCEWMKWECFVSNTSLRLRILLLLLTSTSSLKLLMRTMTIDYVIAWCSRELFVCCKVTPTGSKRVNRFICTYNIFLKTVQNHNYFFVPLLILILTL